MDQQLSSIYLNAKHNFTELAEYRGIEVYHYTSVDGMLGIVQPDGFINLWFTQYDSLNDRNERNELGLYISQYCDRKECEGVFSKAYSNFIKKLEFSSRYYVAYQCYEPLIVNGEKVADEYLNSEPKECYTYLCCFTKNKDSLAMWNYYAKSKQYDGCNFGVFINQMEEPIDYCRIHFKKVIYSSEEKNKILDTILTPLASKYDDINQEERDHYKGFLIQLLGEYQYLFKDECFMHEQEVRAILQVPKDFKGNGIISCRKYRNSNGYIVPYVVFSRKLVLTDVTIGPLHEKEIAQNNMKDFLSSNGQSVSNVKVSEIPIRF